MCYDFKSVNDIINRILFWDVDYKNRYGMAREAEFWPLQDG